MTTIIADGFWYLNTRTGQKQWMTSDMLLAKIRRRTTKAEIEALAEAIGVKFRQQREKHDAELEALRAELIELKAAMPLRAVGGRAAA